ncbi:MAG: DUF4276 family protein [Magnetococcus sp. DMHC-6]
MVNIRILAEGGGERGMPRRGLDTEMRQAFKTFIKKSGIPEERFRVMACGSRDQAFKMFQSALNKENPNEYPLLLVDSEDPVLPNDGAWTHLKKRDGWNRPRKATDNQAHLMTQCMESWFLADVNSLVCFFGDGFKINGLPSTTSIDAVPKTDVLDKLEKASDGSKKGKYHKGNHSCEILGRIDPKLVQNKSPWASKLFKTMNDLVNQNL